MKYFSFNQINKFLNFFYRKEKVYYLEHVSPKLNNKYIEIVNSDILNLNFYAKTFINAYKLLKKKINLKNINYRYISFSSLIPIVNEKFNVSCIQKIYEAEILAKLIKQKYKIDKIFLLDDQINLELYSILKNKKNIKFEISFLSKIFIKLKKLLKNLYLSINLFFIPEILFLNCSLNSTKKKYISNCFNLDISALNEKRDPNEINNLYFNKNTNNLNLFLIRFQHNKKNLKDIPNIRKSTKYVILNDIIKLFSFFEYFSKYYLNFFVKRFFYMSYYFKYNNLEIFKLLKETFYWDLFFKKFEVKKFISIMNHSIISEQFFQKKNSKETIFIYLSSSDFYSAERKKNTNIIDNIQYSYMNFDTLVCDFFSKDFFSNKTNNFAKTINLYNLKSSLSLAKKNNLLNILKKKYPKKKTIVFYDNTCGYGSVINNKNYEIYLNFIFDFMKKNKKYNFYLKFKNSEVDRKYKNIFYKIMKLDNYIPLPKNTNSIKLFGISNVSISLPQSSIINELISLNKPVFIYDLNKYYKKHLYNKLGIVLNNLDSLQRKILEVMKDNYQYNNHRNFFIKSNKYYDNTKSINFLKNYVLS